MFEPLELAVMVREGQEVHDLGVNSVVTQRVLDLLYLVCGSPRSSSPEGAYSLAEQHALSATIANARAVNTWIIESLPILNRARFFIAASVLSASPMVVLFMSALLSRRPLTGFETAVAWFLVVMSILGFEFVTRAYDQFRRHRSSIARLSPTPAECERMSDYVRLVFDHRNQWLAILVFCLWAAATAIYLGIIPRSAPTAILFVWWLLTFGVVIGNGGYWAILTPQYVYVVVNSKNLHCDAFAPAETPGIRALSLMLGTYAFMNATTLSAMYLGFSTIPFPVPPEKVRALATVHLLFGAIIVGYSFVFPQVILARLVARLKADLQDRLLEQQATFIAGQVQSTSGELVAIQRLLDRVRSSRTSPIAMRAVVSYASSVAVGTAAVLLKDPIILGTLRSLIR